MVTIPRPKRLTIPALPLPVAGAAGSGGLVALFFLLMPSGMLERLVSASGVPAVLAAAEPPLGFTARIALGFGLGALVAAFAWFGLRLIASNRPLDLSRLTGWLRRGDVHPDAPPRPPLFAHRDLGTPFLDVKAAPAEPESPTTCVPPLECELPADLDQPLAAFDPAAIPAVPQAPAAAVEPLVRAQLIDPGDRFETFELTPLQRAESSAPVAPLPLRATPTERPLEAEPTPVITPATETTVNALLARLERGIAVREAAAMPPRTSSLQDTLGDLRRLATGTR